jgi:pimeloyl-ACP methyl ester carboxylesterase
LSEQPHTGDWSLDAFARDLDAVIEATCRDERPVVVGHSLGGMVILQYACMFHADLGDRVAGLLALGATDVDPVPGLVPAAAPIARPAVALLAAAAARSPGSFDRVRKSQSTIVAALVKLMGFGPGVRRNELAFIHRLLESTPADVLVATFAALRSIDVRAQLCMIDLPTVVAVGSRDRLTPPATAKRIAHEIHGAELWTLRGAGHMAQLEEPDAFNERLRSFAAFPGAHYGGRRIGSR